MKTLLAALAILVAAGAATAPALADEYAFKRTLVFTVPASGAASVEIAGRNGNIRLYADGGSTVRVHAVLGARSEQALRELNVTAARAGTALRLADVCPSSRQFIFWTFADCDIELEVHYPRALALRLRNENGDIAVDGPGSGIDVTNGNGDIRVNGAGGAVDVQNGNGDVAIVGAPGNLTATGGNGNVSAALAKNWRGSTIVMHTNAGNVHLRVPRGFAAAITAKVTMGEVKNTADVRNGPASVTATTRFGDVTISSE